MKDLLNEPDSNDLTNAKAGNWLHNDLKKIMEPLSVVKFIPDLIRELKQTIVKQFTNLFTGQVEADVITRQATIKVLNKKIESTDRHIKHKEENLTKTVERIEERYTILTDQLNQEHEAFLRKLDSHAYDIVEKIYPSQIRNRFSSDSLPCIDFLAEHAKASVSDRSVCLEQGMNDAQREVAAFIEKRQLLYHELEEFECLHLDEGAYELPWCFVQLENRETGETKFECWFECELESGRKNMELDELRTEIQFLAENLNNSKKSVHQFVKDIDGFLNEKLMIPEKERFLSDLLQHYN
ncbi:MAG: hypothetical protein ABFD10_15890 [Prolixibacteraceae bacterium]